MSVELVAAPHRKSLAELARTIRDEVTACESAAVSAVEHAIAAGEVLIESQGQIAEGHWLHWVENECHLGQATAAGFIRLATYKDEVRARGPHAGSGAALRSLRSLPAVGRVRVKYGPEVRESAKRLLRDGVSQSETARILNLSTATVHYWAHDGKRRHTYAEQKRDRLRREKKEAQQRAIGRAVAKRGGQLPIGYSHLRRALQALDVAARETEDPELQAHLVATVRRLYQAEDELGLAFQIERGPQHVAPRGKRARRV